MSTESDESPGEGAVRRFVRLSRRLSGMHRLAEAAASQHLATISASAPAALRRLLVLADEHATEEDLSAALGRADPDVQAVARQVILLWYVGRPSLKPSALSPEAYAGSLLFEVIGAHLPGVSGGYFGYWRYPPER